MYAFPPPPLRVLSPPPLRQSDPLRLRLRLLSKPFSEGPKFLYDTTDYIINSNKLNTIIRIAKRNYYDEPICLVKNNFKETWKLLDGVINKFKGKPSLPNIFNHGNQTLSDPVEIAKQFCEYFANGGPNLAKQILLVDIPFNSFLTDRISETIFLYPTDITEVSNICESLKSGKSAGSDDITMNIIKKSFKFIAQPLTEIINGSLLILKK